MNYKSLRLITYLVASYLLTACQAKQYGFFQASKAVHHPTEQRLDAMETIADEQLVEEPVKQLPLPTTDTTAVETEQLIASADQTTDKSFTINKVTASSRSAKRVERKADKKALRAELRAALKQYKARPAEGETNGLATASFITGLCSFIFLFVPGINILSLILGPLALILGIVSIGQITNRGQKGLGLGIAGIVLGSVFVLLLLLAVAALSSTR